MKSGVVTILGRPNSGKSTLLNALVRHKVSIVSDKPQTTRHRILGILTESRGQVLFVDTPGIHKPNYRMNERMLQSVYDSLLDVDLVLLLRDASIPFGRGESFVLEVVKKAATGTILLLNKIDKIAKPKLLPIMEQYSREHDFLEIIPISALTGDNLDILLGRVFDHLEDADALFGPDQFTDRSERFLAAEFIREKVLQRARQELPYATAVLIRKFDESRRHSKKLVVIEADILVEKRSQQGIILGAGGSRIKEVGIGARRDLEALLGCSVYLGLRVRTERNWRDDDRILDRMDLGT